MTIHTVRIETVEKLKGYNKRIEFSTIGLAEWLWLEDNGIEKYEQVLTEKQINELKGHFIEMGIEDLTTAVRSSKVLEDSYNNISFNFNVRGDKYDNYLNSSTLDIRFARIYCAEDKSSTMRVLARTTKASCLY